MSEHSNTFFWIALFAIIAALVNGAGMLISTPLILALPQAIQKNFYSGFMALIGFLFMFFSNEFINYLTKKDGNNPG